jgi:hypothetical protein
MYASNTFNLREVEKTQGRSLSLSLEESFSTVLPVSIILFSPPKDYNPFWSTGKFNTFPFALSMRLGFALESEFTHLA